MFGKKKEHLIPMKESKRVIRLEERGHRQNRVSVGGVLFALLGVLCAAYCMFIALFMGYGSYFFLIWGVLAVVCLILSVILFHKEFVKKLPRWFKVSSLVCFVAGILFFGAIEGTIISKFSAQAKPGADYMIILGAQWKPRGPSYVLQKRLDTALIYLQENPDTKVIVSGGQGSNEPISEAQGMSEYLIKSGISEERIIIEDKSTSTYENLSFSGELFDKSNQRVVLITSNFHVYRVEQIAKKQGYAQAESLAAPSHPAMVANNMMREFFGVLKDWWIGNM